MRIVRRVVTVTVEYADYTEAARHILAMEGDGWAPRKHLNNGVVTVEYTLEVAEEGAV